MFAIYSLMDVPFERFEIAPIPAREPEPVVKGGGPEPTPPVDPLRRLGLVSSGEQNPRDELASLGLVREHHRRDDLAIFSLARLFAWRGKKRGT